MDSRTYHHNINRQRDISGASTDNLTPRQYTPASESAATSKTPRDGNGQAGIHKSRKLGWLQLGFHQPFEWNHLPVAIPQLPKVLDGLRILHLTDLHAHKRWLRSYDLLLNQLRQDPPDLILFTGDFVEDMFDHRRALPFLERFLTQLSSRLGVWAIVGNHDRDLLMPRLGAWGIKLIAGKYVRLESHEAAIELIGLKGVKRRDFEPEWAATIPRATPGVPRIVLGHYPDQVELIGSLEADLMLSGHTHGGQICLPGGKALLTHDSLPKWMARGSHRVGKTLLVVNRGFGTVRWPIRISCPAEVIELHLTAAI